MVYIEVPVCHTFLPKKKSLVSLPRMSPNCMIVKEQNNINVWEASVLLAKFKTICCLLFSDRWHNLIIVIQNEIFFQLLRAHSDDKWQKHLALVKPFTEDSDGALLWHGTASSAAHCPILLLCLTIWPPSHCTQPNSTVTLLKAPPMRQTILHYVVKVTDSWHFACTLICTTQLSTVT